MLNFKLAWRAGAIVASVMAYSGLASAVKIGAPAPAIATKDIYGHEVNLADFKGKKYVVLEWHNKDCPFVKAQYQPGKMQALQAKWTEKGVAWFTIVSSAPGKQGNVDAAGAMADIKANRSHETSMILDPTGAIGHAYDAKTTPHLFVINLDGNVIYNGAIDDAHVDDSSNEKPKGMNYVDLALQEAMIEKKASLTHATSVPYGCSVKYGH
jgi:peroxiredoxin